MGTVSNMERVYHFSVHPVRKLENWLTKVTVILDNVAAAMLFFLMVQCSADVILRYFVKRPIEGTMERSEVLLALIVFLSWGYTHKEKGHISVDLFIAQCSDRVRAIFNFVTTFIVIILFILIMWQGLVTALVYHSSGRIVYVIHWPLALFQLFVPFSALIVCLLLFGDMIRAFGEIVKK